VSEIVDAVAIEQSAVSHQLRVLRDHSVVTMRRIGRTREYALRDQHIGAPIDNALEHTRAPDQPTHEVAHTPTSAVHNPFTAAAAHMKDSA
jgi:DNA-binding transcriptional ArsR family regulator